MPSSMINGCRRERGFSLIEVLVAMLVLAIGLLGLAALQAQGMRFNHDAHVRTSATNLASDIIDKMRINRDNASSYTTANFPTRNSLPTDGYSVENPPYDCTGASALNASATGDLACWLNGIELNLPLGRATIAAQATAGLYDITIMWLDREPREFSDGTRLANTSGECTALANRSWVSPPGQCFVTQTWSVWP